MSGGDEGRTPGAGQRTGGTGENENDHSNIIPKTIPADAAGTDQKDLLEFLTGWSEDGPWWATSIPREGGRTETVTFTNLGDFTEWKAKWSGKKNLYFSVNDLSPNTSEKASKDEVTRVRGLHVDVDPRPIEGGPDGRMPEELAAHNQAERARIRAMADDWERDCKKLPFPRPTAVIDSGGGYQFFWRFDDGEEVTPDQAEALNAMLSAAMGGDSTHDVSRIMRLCGTVNLANAKKRKAGRTDAPALLVEADWSRRYRLSDFPEPPVKRDATAGDGAARVNLSEDLPKLASLDDLPSAVSSRTKMLIVNGDDPDDPTKYPSRSEVLFAVLCEMVRAGVDDDVMASVVLDGDYTISAHIRAQPNPRRYVARQIQRAHDEAVDPALRELNDQFTVLENEGGKCRILEFVEMPTGVKGKTRSVVTLQSFEDFRNRFLNRNVVVGTDKEGNDVKMALGKWWLQNAARRQFHSLTFRPRDGEEVGTGATRQLNLWQGFTVPPMQGDWSLMRAHIRDVLASGDEASDRYIIRWMAWTLQNPDEPAEVALTFRGEPGTGKGVFGRAMAQVFGQHGLHTGGSEMITGRFNKHFRDCCLLFADEVVWDGDRKAEAKVKTFLTEPTLMIEGKGVDAVTWPNMLHVIISSNSEWVVPAGPFERRYAVFDVAATQRQRRGYFAPLFAELESGGLAAMLYDLLAMDLGRWHPREDVPKTDALNDQKSRGLDPVHAAVLDMLREGALPSDISADARGTDARPFVATDELAAFVQRQSRAVVTSVVVSKLLDKIGGEKNRKRRPSGYVLPLLAEARAAWDAQPDLPAQIWDDAADWAGGGEPW